MVRLYVGLIGKNLMPISCLSTGVARLFYRGDAWRTDAGLKITGPHSLLNTFLFGGSRGAGVGLVAWCAPYIRMEHAHTCHCITMPGNQYCSSRYQEPPNPHQTKVLLVYTCSLSHGALVVILAT